MMLDFDFSQLMRMSSVKRWGIIEMSRDQSVAEHSYNVCVISVILYNEHARDMIKTPKIDLRKMMEWAIAHDLPELVTGDIPTPFKKEICSSVDKFESRNFPGYWKFYSHLENDNPLILSIVKMADMIDAIQFAGKFCVDTRKDTIMAEMVRNLDRLIVNSEAGYHMQIREPISKMIDVV